MALITNPWMVKWRERLPARRTMGLVFDSIPNLFGVLLDDGKPFAFAHQHGHGFKILRGVLRSDPHHLGSDAGHVSSTSCAADGRAAAGQM